MKTTIPKQIIGSVSHGTMREEDLIPCFLEVLKHFDSDRYDELMTEHAPMLERLDTDQMTDDDMEEASYLLNEVLFDALNSFAPPYFYFGAHPGDGSDYGFWLSEGFEQDFEDDGGLKVSDLSEVPDDYSGEVLLVNDHGNCTLYAAENGQLTEVWSVV